MSDAKGQQEPSMEEILASIRRIISEDSDAEAMPPRPQPAPEPKPEPMPEPPALAPEPEPEPVIAVAPDGERIAADDVLDLTQMVTEDGSVTASDGTVVPADEPASDATDDTELEFAEIGDDADLLAEADEPEPLSPEPAEPEPVAADPAPAGGGAAPLAAFEQLQRVVQAKKERPVPPPPRPAPAAGGLTVEHLVSEAIRPMVRDWLDENLQPIVERMVAREIKRIASQSDD